MESEYYAYDWDAPIRRIFTGVCDVVYQGAQHRLFLCFPVDALGKTLLIYNFTLEAVGSIPNLGISNHLRLFVVLNSFYITTI